MSHKSLFSSIGLAFTAIGLVIAVAAISVLPNWRVDLTEDQLYTLSEGTRNIVGNLEEPVELMFFYSDSATEDVPQIRSYANRVQELLEEISIAGNGMLSYRLIDPEPFSEDEDLATRYGIQPVPISQGGEEVYFGLVAVQDVDETLVPFGARASETMPLIRPDQEEFLEYEFMKLVTQVANPDRQVVGLITPLDIDGGFNPMTGQASSPWMVMEIIRQFYEVRRIPVEATAIDDDVDILVVVHPSDFSEQLLYAIDQFVLAKGSALVFLDPNADSMVSRMPQGNLVPAGMSSDMPALLQAWGIEYSPEQVLTDSDLALRVMMQQGGRPSPHLGMLGAQRANLAQEDIITRGLETINLSSSGTIRSAESSGLIFEPLIQSSRNSMLMDSALLQDVMDPSVLFDEFEPSGETQVVAARITGMVETAFPDGPPPPPVEANEAEVEGEEGAESADAPAENDVPEAEDTTTVSETDAESTVEAELVHLSSSAGGINLLVFADTDVLSDRMWVQVQQFLGQRIPRPFANNGDLVVNALDNLSGGADLVSIRSRGRYSRPFSRVMDLQREADDRLRTEEATLLDRMSETEDSLAQLSQDEEGNPLSQITPEIQAEIDRFNSELLDTRRRLRDVQYQLTEDIEQLGTRLKAINTFLIPVLLTVFALGYVFLRSGRRRRTLVVNQ